MFTGYPSRLGAIKIMCFQNACWLVTHSSPLSTRPQKNDFTRHPSVLDCAIIVHRFIFVIVFFRFTSNHSRFYFVFVFFKPIVVVFVFINEVQSFSFPLTLPLTKIALVQKRSGEWNFFAFWLLTKIIPISIQCTAKTRSWTRVICVENERVTARPRIEEYSKHTYNFTVHSC